MSQRALDTLERVSLIAAEDTRHTAMLTRHFGITTPLVAYHDHNEQEATEQLINRLQGGESVALVSDAGTPLISDPGYRLVRGAHDCGVEVIPLPGPCAAIVALSASGLPTDSFHFAGFLPAKSTPRRARLAELAAYSATIVLYEAPHRIVSTLNDALEAFGGAREAVLVRELTKTYETIRRASLEDLVSWVEGDQNQQKGEQVLLIAPAPRASKEGVTDRERQLLKRLAEELPPRKAAALGAELTGHKARYLYDLLLEEEQ